MRFADVVDSLESKTIKLRGKDVEIRGVSGADCYALSRQIRIPSEQPPAGADPEAYADTRALAIARSRALLIAACAGWENSAGEPWSVSRSTEWCESFADEILRGLTDGELLHVWSAAAKLLYTASGDWRDEQSRIGTESEQGN